MYVAYIPCSLRDGDLTSEEGKIQLLMSGRSLRTRGTAVGMLSEHV